MLDKQTVAGIDAARHILGTTTLQRKVLRLVELFLRVACGLPGLRPEVSLAKPEKWSQVGETGSGDSNRGFDASPYNEGNLVVLGCQYFFTDEVSGGRHVQVMSGPEWVNWIMATSRMISNIKVLLQRVRDILIS